MTTKRAIIATLISVAVVLGLGILLLVLFVDINAPGAEERAKAFGSALGFLCVFPSMIIWARWGLAIRSQREAAAQKKSKKKTRVTD